MSDNIFLKALDSAVSAFAASPQMATKPPRPDPVPRHLTSELPGDQPNPITAMLNAPGNPNSPMDKVKVIQRLPDPLAEVPGNPAERIARFGQGFPVPGDYQTTIAELEQKWQWNHTEGSKYWPGQDRVAFRASQNEINESAVSGKTVSEHAGWSLEDFQEEHKSKLRAHKLAQQAISREAHEVVSKLARNYFQFLNAVAAKVEAADIENYSKYGMPYSASSLVLAIRKAAQQVLAAVNDYHQTSGTSPATLAKMLPL